MTHVSPKDELRREWRERMRSGRLASSGSQSDDDGSGVGQGQLTPLYQVRKRDVCARQRSG